MPNPVYTATSQGYDPFANASYGQPITTTYTQPITTTYAQPTTTTYAQPVTTYTYAPAPTGTEVRNTSYNYGLTGGVTGVNSGVAGANLTSQVRNTVVDGTVAAPPKITFGQPSGGYVTTTTTTNNAYISFYSVSTTCLLKTSPPPPWSIRAVPRSSPPIPPL